LLLRPLLPEESFRSVPRFDVVLSQGLVEAEGMKQGFQTMSLRLSNLVFAEVAVPVTRLHCAGENWEFFK